MPALSPRPIGLGHFEAGFATLAERGVDALIVLPDPFLDSHREKLVKLAARYAIPAIYQWREFVQAGGLISYGTSLADVIGSLATMPARFFKE